MATSHGSGRPRGQPTLSPDRPTAVHDNVLSSQKRRRVRTEKLHGRPVLVRGSHTPQRNKRADPPDELGGLVDLPSWFGQCLVQLARSVVGRLPVGLNLAVRGIRRRSLLVLGRAVVDDYGLVSNLESRREVDELVVTEEAIQDFREIEDLVAGFHTLRRRT